MSVTIVTEAQSAGVVLGLSKVDGSPVPRRDIDDLMLNEPDTFNLFLLALIELKKDSSRDEKMGFYQLAGKRTELDTELLLTDQGYMACPSKLGTVNNPSSHRGRIPIPRSETIGAAIVLMRHIPFRAGIGRTWQ